MAQVGETYIKVAYNPSSMIPYGALVTITSMYNYAATVNYDGNEHLVPIELLEQEYAKFGYSHEYVNISFRHMYMAYKHCGENK